jgi:ribosomal protein S18 acetylase RimI-like enzyme
MSVVCVAVPDDAPAILALQKLAYESEARLYNDWSISPLMQTLDSLIAEFQTHTILKAVIDGQIVGSVRCRTVDGDCAIGRLFVDPQFQGQGIGSSLLRAAEAEASGARKFSLFTGSRSEANIHLYRRHGYEIVRTDKLSPAVSLVFMEKPCASL